MLFSYCRVLPDKFAAIRGLSGLDVLIATTSVIATLNDISRCLEVAGHGEVQHLDANGCLFTIFLFLFSITIAAYSASTLISFIFQGRIVWGMRVRPMNRVFMNLSNHYIICGHMFLGKKLSGIPALYCSVRDH